MISAPVDAVAYALAPQSVLAPVGMLGIVFNLVAAQRVHGDQSSRRDAVATVLIIGGAVVCMLHGADSGNSPGVTPSMSAFLAYTVCIIATGSSLGGLLFALRRKGGAIDALANAVLAGILGSVTVVATKVISATLRASKATLVSMALACVPLVLIAPVHLFVQNRGLGRYPLVFMSPVGGSASLLANVATGCFLYSEVPTAPQRFCLGVLVLCFGVLQLCAWERLSGEHKNKQA